MELRRSVLIWKHWMPHMTKIDLARYPGSKKSEFTDGFKPRRHIFATRSSGDRRLWALFSSERTMPTFLMTPDVQGRDRGKQTLTAIQPKIMLQSRVLLVWPLREFRRSGSICPWKHLKDALRAHLFYHSWRVRATKVKSTMMSTLYFSWAHCLTMKAGQIVDIFPLTATWSKFRPLAIFRRRVEFSCGRSW